MEERGSLAGKEEAGEYAGDIGQLAYRGSWRDNIQGETDLSLLSSPSATERKGRSDDRAAVTRTYRLLAPTAATELAARTHHPLDVEIGRLARRHDDPRELEGLVGRGQHRVFWDVDAAVIARPCVDVGLVLWLDHPRAALLQGQAEGEDMEV